MPAGTAPTHLQTDCSANLLASTACPLLQALLASVHPAACLAEACSPAEPSTCSAVQLQCPMIQEEAALKRSSTSAADSPGSLRLLLLRSSVLQVSC